MPKKKEKQESKKIKDLVESNVKDNTKRLTSAQYWEWRCSIEEMKSAKLNEKRIHLEKEIMNKEIENKKLRLALFKETLGAARNSVANAELEYGKFKERLELELDVDLNNCIIDEVTYELKKLESD